MNVLLVEDDLPLAAGVTQALRDKDYVVNQVGLGQHALDTIKVDPPDILILDLGLPDMDGIEVLKKLRQTNPELPVLLLTARISVEEKVQGLDAGADDYLAKPFNISELLARLRVMERRLSPGHSTLIKVGPLSFDSLSCQVTLNGESLVLSRREYMLLKILVENAGRVMTRSRLESGLYSWDEGVGSNALEVHVHNLRKKLGPDLIKTVRGVGYRLAGP